ncbi:hypothetical protein MADA3029_510046 [Vibrio nigripulchritudo MADA3029]|nr:hypothetical protein VIBNIAM115_540022 [Vibrio nigripulchritudo AM115]CCN42378.1 hypothetical protein VIBNIFTn2_290040 [Vibrio nigripulchritudo FTn2]CCN49490.1 hypothetical protein VIBNIMADA3020_750045 [Vibrio nigripulchritudo MADA3020]CCN51326.1 hypothetical protein VIBNIMADA3021_1040045 [Vibrio nigripulchritudo MADA3021]CCN59962.1 hypothetical protein MADA3029_510046 [Vibrio nigripulchritudo MADA3029]CCN67133.1 hypothetical protein VIBNIPon4_700040 [Vibrio nigripulchritudo POn4]CCN79320.
MSANLPSGNSCSGKDESPVANYGKGVQQNEKSKDNISFYTLHSVTECTIISERDSYSLVVVCSRNHAKVH